MALLTAIMSEEEYQAALAEISLRAGSDARGDAERLAALATLVRAYEFQRHGQAAPDHDLVAATLT
jgi:antitoxin component HigA of HigAB toxin-antitoxin module